MTQLLVKLFTIPPHCGFEAFLDIETDNFVAKDIVVIKERESMMMLDSLIPYKREMVDMFFTMLVLVNKCFIAKLHRLFHCYYLIWLNLCDNGTLLLCFLEVITQIYEIE